ncbi:MAG: hypothetical protein AUF67_12870 [Acidobacteria bacterium 13_1_20CM_58_21]|nr:MAG: hypothetical protein AUF67_12870 [Acidobacteria bacterium 13_1_20CM_58_21]
MVWGSGANTGEFGAEQSWPPSASTPRIGDTNMTARTSSARNDYRCSIDRNQSGKYCVRIQVHYHRHAWTLGIYYLASSFDRAMKKLEEALDFLQRQEEKLWFWGVDRAEDMGFSAEFLKEAGLRLDRRTEFPRKATNVSLTPERQVPAFVLGPMRRGLAESVEMSREVSRSAAAGD